MENAVKPCNPLAPLQRLRLVPPRLLTEPLVHFLILGFILFWADREYQHQTSVYRIIETPARTAYLARQYALQFGIDPDESMLQLLVRRDIDDEILFREGIALGLDRGDEIVRRRIVQKMRFLLHDTSAPPEPTQDQLQDYHASHIEQYERPPDVTFSHVFFSDDVPGAHTALVRAQTALGTLHQSDAERASELGDPFPDQYDFAGYVPLQVERLFGDSEFSRAVFTAPTGEWSGPFRSGYGWHLLHVHARHAASTPSFAEVSEAVRTDYLKEQQQKENATAFAKLAARFTVQLRGEQ